MRYVADKYVFAIIVQVDMFDNIFMHLILMALFFLKGDPKSSRRSPYSQT